MTSSLIQDQRIAFPSLSTTLVHSVASIPLPSLASRYHSHVSRMQCNTHTYNVLWPLRLSSSTQLCRLRMKSPYLGATSVTSPADLARARRQAAGSASTRRKCCTAFKQPVAASPFRHPFPDICIATATSCCSCLCTQVSTGKDARNGGSRSSGVVQQHRALAHPAAAAPPGLDIDRMVRAAHSARVGARNHRREGRGSGGRAASALPADAQGRAQEDRDGAHVKRRQALL